MSARSKAFWVGLFLAGAMLVLISILLFWSQESLMKSQVTYTIFFDRSVKGLNPGAPLMYRGVSIGAVTRINFADMEPWNQEQKEDQDKTVVLRPAPVQVMVAIDASRLQAQLNPDSPLYKRLAAESKNRIFADQIVDMWASRQVLKNHLRAQLQVLSFVTGQLYIELVPMEDDELTEQEELNLRVDHVIPTRLSSIESLQKNMEEGRLQQALFSAEKSLDHLQKIVASPQVDVILGNVAQFSENLVEISRKVKVFAEDMERLLHSPRAQQAGADLQNALNVWTKTGESLKKVSDTFVEKMEQDSPARRQVTETMQELQRVSESLRSLVDQLQRNPESLLFGR